MSRVSVRGTLSNTHYEIARMKVETLNSTLQSYVCAAIDGRSLEDGNSLERIGSGLERRLPSMTEAGSSEPRGVGREDTVRRPTRAREPKH